jgi:hypothetical protein
MFQMTSGGEKMVDAILKRGMLVRFAPSIKCG